MPEYVIVGDHYWARGATQEEAKSQFRKEGGRLSRGYVLLYFNGTTSHFVGVDNVYGAVSWTGERPVEVARRKGSRLAD